MGSWVLINARWYYPPTHTNGNASEKATGLNLGLVTIDPVAMLRGAAPDNWHNAMLGFTAYCVAAGYPDWIIVEAARQVLDDPNNPSDLESLIEGARRKFDKPDPGEIEAGPLNVVGLSSFINMKLPERKTLLSPWLPEQGPVMVYAERGIGKTYFALNVAHAVATGGSYLNWQANGRHRVLYLDGEMPAPTMQERSRAIAGFNPPEDLNDWFRLMTPDLQNAAMPDLSTKEGQARIEAQLAGVELVVIDNLSTLCRSGIENEAESWLPVQEWLLGKHAIKWTRLSCRKFRNNEVRLQLHALAYNLANFMRTLALPKEVEHWSLTTLREKLVKIGAKVVRHGRYVTFQLAEAAVPRELFQKILSLIDDLRRRPVPA